MTQEYAKKIAEKNLADFPSRSIVMSFGLWKDGYLFSYKKDKTQGGHCGKPLYVHISDNGYRLLEDTKEITEAIVFASSFLQRSS